MTGEGVVRCSGPIERLVETDLATLRLAASGSNIRLPAAVDLDRLYNEFSRTTRLELDFVQDQRRPSPRLRTTPASTSRMCSGRSRPAC